MRILLPACFCLLSLLCLPGTLHAASGAIAVKEALAPHKALYDIKMIAKRSGSQVINISGQMFYEWRPGCEAWTTDHRFNLFYEYADSPPVRITSDFSTYERYDGAGFNFSSRRKRNGDLYQEIRGNAERGEDTAGEAVYSMPAGLVYDIETGTLFPMAHTVELLDRARKGEKFYNARIFDGSDEDGPVEVSSFIGAPATAPATVIANEAVEAALVESPAWAVRMAFFPLIGADAASAEYEMDVIFHDNGVISDMVVEYQDFSVSQTLAALERLDVKACEPDTARQP